MDMTKFKQLLDDQMTWPDYYTFKFVVKADDKSELISTLSGMQWTEKPSKTGKYISLTSRKLVNSSEEVVEIYQLASKVKGVITL